MRIDHVVFDAQVGVGAPKFLQIGQARIPPCDDWLRLAKRLVGWIEPHRVYTGRQRGDEIARVARGCVVFGDAGLRLARYLRKRNLAPIVTDDLESAVAAATRIAAGASAIVFSPIFPVALDDRRLFATLVDDAER